MLKNFVILEVNVRDIYVIKDRCVLCNLCKEVCPANCIFDGEESVEINKEKCMFCGRCVKVCPTKAIKLVRKVRYLEDGVVKEREIKKYVDIFYNYRKCISCLICVKNCIFGAMSIEENKFKDKIVIDKKKCELCGKCEEICPTKAIYLKGV
ncbi:4Fe-4S ferredoxin iron-sulfur binding domain protein [Methanocaldococcus infernus ME]|uniref:4Fe-4S ferredoxin iron-sulfur binding domain protein n=1 Tax=Methanocaldococcus infernus (strain DSM 11812 / JCM 15783 / ME) TaxID=573063 RepID=D5VTP0_METIM|nr:4Fe-4S ferredoxin iron-sulfur binding domain protein [Methanocaldococcus infernus ME]